MESSHKTSQKISPKHYEDKADKMAEAAERAKPKQKISLLWEAIDLYNTALKSSKNKLPIHLSILSCYEQIIEASNDPLQKQQYASVLVEKIIKDKLLELTNDEHDLFDLHYMLFKAYRLLGKTSKALLEAKEIKDRYPNLEKRHPTIVKAEKKAIEDYDAKYIKKYKKDYKDARNFITSAKDTDNSKANSSTPVPTKRKRASSKDEEELISSQIIENTASLSLQQNDNPIFINNYGGNIYVTGSVNVTINNITTNAPHKTANIVRKAKKTKDEVQPKKQKMEAEIVPTPRIEIVNGEFVVDGVIAKKMPSQVQLENGVYTADGVELVDHGGERSKYNVEERAKQNRADKLPSPSELPDNLSKKQLAAVMKRRKANDERERLEREKEYAELKKARLAKLAKKRGKKQKKEPSEEIVLQTETPVSDTKEDELLSARSKPKVQDPVLYKAPLPRLAELGNVTTKEMDQIDQVIENKWGLFQASKIDSKVVKKQEIKVSAKPTLKELKYKPKSKTDRESFTTLENTFKRAYQAYVDDDHETALKLLLEALLLSKELANNDKSNRNSHQQNTLLIAHYMEYIITLVVDDTRKTKAAELNEEVDSVETLFTEEFEFRDPCDYTTPMRSINQPTKKEFDYSQTIYPDSLTPPAKCEAHQKSLAQLNELETKAFEEQMKKARSADRKPNKRALAKETQNEDQIKELKQKIQNHQFRPERETKEEEQEQVTSNPLDLHTAINADIIANVLEEDQVRNLVTNVIDIAFPKDGKESTDKPQKPIKRKTEEEQEEATTIEPPKKKVFTPSKKTDMKEANQDKTISNPLSSKPSWSNKQTAPRTALFKNPRRKQNQAPQEVMDSTSSKKNPTSNF